MAEPAATGATPDPVRLLPARADDVPAIAALLEANRLPTAGLEKHLDSFVVAEAESKMVGCGGLEAYPEASAGIVRSIAVDAGWHGRGLGTRLTDWVLARAASLGLGQLYLFTVDARDFFPRFGFRETTLEHFPPALRRSAQYRAIRRFGHRWEGTVAMGREE